MEAEERYATPRQMAYIRSLSEDAGTTLSKPLEELTVTEASELIADLLAKAKPSQNGKEGNEGRGLIATPVKKNDFGSGAGLGMAFKCVYRNWVTSGENVFKDRKAFIKNVLDTYALINEIAEKALQTAA